MASQSDESADLRLTPSSTIARTIARRGESDLHRYEPAQVEPTGSTLIGELHERPVAALSLSDGKVIADSFVATADVVALLRLRARQLGARRRGRFVRRFVGCTDDREQSR